MVDPYVSTPVIADKAEQPLGDQYNPGTHGGLPDATGTTLSLLTGRAICDVAAWPGRGNDMRATIRTITGLDLAGSRGAFSGTAQALEHAPDRWTVISDDAGLPERLEQEAGDAGTVVDLSHGRVLMRLCGPASRHVLSKLLSVDLRPASLPIGSGLATRHHEIFVQLQRIDADDYDLIVYRSYARAFWHRLTRAAEETGYAVT